MPEISRRLQPRHRGLRRGAAQGKRHTVQHRLLPGRRVHRWGGTGPRCAVAGTVGTGLITRAATKLTANANIHPYQKQTCALASHVLCLGNARAPPAPAITPQGCAACRHPRQTAHCAASAPARPARAQVGRHGAAVRCCRYGRHGFDHSCSNQANCKCQHPSLPKTDMCVGVACAVPGECESAAGACNHATGVCGVPPPKANGTLCSIGSCQAGVCTGGGG